jgi:hypothetical protein
MNGNFRLARDRVGAVGDGIMDFGGGAMALSRVTYSLLRSGQPTQARRQRLFLPGSLRQWNGGGGNSIHL